MNNSRHRSRSFYDEDNKDDEFDQNILKFGTPIPSDTSYLGNENDEDDDDDEDYNFNNENLKTQKMNNNNNNNNNKIDNIINNEKKTEDIEITNNNKKNEILYDNNNNNDNDEFEFNDEEINRGRSRSRTFFSEEDPNSVALGGTRGDYDPSLPPLPVFNKINQIHQNNDNNNEYNNIFTSYNDNNNELNNNNNNINLDKNNTNNKKKNGIGINGWNIGSNNLNELGKPSLPMQDYSMKDRKGNLNTSELLALQEGLTLGMKQKNTAEIREENQEKKEIKEEKKRRIILRKKIIEDKKKLVNIKKKLNDIDIDDINNDNNINNNEDKDNNDNNNNEDDINIKINNNNNDINSKEPDNIIIENKNNNDNNIIKKKHERNISDTSSISSLDSFNILLRQQRKIKLLLIGDRGVGKTSLLKRFIKNKFIENLDSTNGLDFKIKDVNVEDELINVQLWDTACKENFNLLTESLYSTVHGIVYIFNAYKEMNNENNINKIKNNINEIKSKITSDIPILILANKYDMIELNNDNNLINNNEIKENDEINNIDNINDKYTKIIEKYFLSIEGTTFYPVSAKTGLNVNEAFMTLVYDLYYKFLANELDELEKIENENNGINDDIIINNDQIKNKNFRKNNGNRLSRSFKSGVKGIKNAKDKCIIS